MIVSNLNKLLESEDAWIVFLLSFFVSICMLEELWYQHPHSLCLICIVDGLLYQKLYDPLFFLIEEYIYIPMCLIVEDLYDGFGDFVIYLFPILRGHERLLHGVYYQCKYRSHTEIEKDLCSHFYSFC